MNTLIEVSKHSCALFKQLNFWHSKSGDGFYKFLAPCEHPWYRKGDSWCEELKVSENTLRKYLKTLCASYSSKKSYLENLDPFDGKPFASYFDRLRKITFYFHNPHFQMKKALGGRGEQKNLASDCGSDCVSILTDKTNNSLYPPKPPLDQNSKKEVGSLTLLKIKKEGRGDLDQKSWELAQKMHSLWQTKTEGAIPTPRLTPRFAEKLLKALKGHFSNSLELWKSYCESVSSSDFLMGRIGTFKAWLVWVIREQTIQKIKNGDLGVKKLFISVKEILKSSQKEIKQAIESLKTSQKIKDLRLSLLKKLGVGEYESWFSRLELQEQGSQMIFKGGGTFTMDQITTRYDALLKKQCLDFSCTPCLERD